MEKYTSFADLKALAQALKSGKVIAFPTDTVFGLACIYDDEKEKQTLEKEIDKIYKRYSMKLNSKELKNKLIDTLLRKGYNYDDIKSVLISKENDNE